MAPPLNLWPMSGCRRTFNVFSKRLVSSTCPFCSLSSRAPQSLRKPRPRASWTRRAASTISAPAAATSSNARKELVEALLELQKHSAGYVNLSRIQLALRGLRQDAGKESIRVAVLGLANGHTCRSAKEILRLMLSDPLKPEEEWERELEKHDTAQPLIVRIGKEQEREEHNTLELAKSSLLPEINVASATLNGNNIEVLIMEMNPFSATSKEGALKAFEEAVLVPTVDIPTSNTGRYTPITTPVHKALIVADGIQGATSAAAMPLLRDKDEIAAAVNFKSHVDDTSSCPFITVDVDSGFQGLAAFRQGVENAMEYKSLWFKSNIPDVLEWLKLGTLNTSDGTTKQPVRKLIASVLQNALAQIQAEEAKRLSDVLISQTSASSFASLNKGLAVWAEGAHEELQEQLDLAFTSRRWRKLGWWKLFWRVDDVTMLSSEMVTRRFLPGAEQEVIYLAGRIAEAGLPGLNKQHPYSVPTAVSSTVDSDKPSNPPPTQSPSPSDRGTKWPTHIPFTRRYLLDETVPALQALAQKLVLQTLSTSALTSSLAGLMFLSSFGAYEAGAVGALGLVWSLGRMQKKWETARDFWEGEVREEGRKAVRSVEASVVEVLDRAKEGARKDGRIQDIRQARERVRKAEDALARLK